MLCGVVGGGVPGWPVAFRGSLARAAGLVTRAQLRGPRFVRVFPDIYVRAGDGPPNSALRAAAAYRLVEGRGVLSGYSAAALLGADCAPDPDGPVEVTVPRGGQRAHPGLRVHRDRVAPGEITSVGGLRCTAPLRTGYDLARQDDLVEAVVAVDRLANVHRFHPDLLLNFAVRYGGCRGNDRVARVLAEASPYAGSPMESRLRMVIVNAGLPRRSAVWLDLAYLEFLIGIEYEGQGHAAPEQVLRDTGRHTRLVDLPIHQVRGVRRAGPDRRRAHPGPPAEIASSVRGLLALLVEFIPSRRESATGPGRAGPPPASARGRGPAAPGRPSRQPDGPGR
jgi:hypothetical protein